MPYKNKSDKKAYNQQYYLDHKKEIDRRSVQWRKNHPEYTRKIHLRHNHDLSCENWLKIWESQDGKCAICGKKFKKSSNAYVDHNHKTGEIRGLLCMKCNFAIGLLNDDLELMKKVIEYLQERGNGKIQ